MVQVSLLITPPPPCSSLYPYTTLFRSVLGADAGVVQPGGDGVGGNGLPVLVLHHEGAGAVQDPGGAARDGRGVAAGADAVPDRPAADQPQPGVVEGGAEKASRIGAPVHASSRRIVQSSHS